MDKLKIFISCHDDFQIIEQPIYQPIHVGAKLANKNFENMLRDDIGDNISDKNRMYCELTAQYWAWKNYQSEYYGFCHYRRYFSFNTKRLVQDIHGAVNYDYLNSKCIEEISPSSEQVIKQVCEADIIIGEPANISKLNIKNLYEQYGNSRDLHIKDLQMAVDIINEIYPEYGKSADRYLNGHLFYPCNMFIMKREVFYKYCEWLFSILDQLEQKIDICDYSVEGRRTLGHIAERLLGIFYTYIKDNCPQYKTKVLQRTIIWNTDKFVKPKPAFNNKNVPIVFACSDFFVPYAGISLASVIEHTSPLNNYDITFLHTNISKESQQQLQALTRNYKNISLRFINITAKISGLKLISNNHVSVETFYRLIAHEIFSEYNKIVYLDSDIIVLKDISDLFSIDIGNNLLAATIDADHSGEYNGAIPNVRKYVDTVLKLKQPHNYVQAGVMVINVKELNKCFLDGELVSIAAKREYMYVDQDVLNMCCEGKIYFLDMSWNVMTDCAGIRVKDIIKSAPVNIYEAYMTARNNPYVIHYAGFDKPWNSPLSDMADVFWDYARKTLFYEALVLRMTSNAIHCSNALKSSHGGIMNIANILFPKGTRRREVLKSIYFKMFKR